MFHFTDRKVTILLRQVAVDLPVGQDTSARGWDKVVDHLKQLGEDWSLLTVRLAREKTQLYLKEFRKKDAENKKKYVTSHKIAAYHT